MHEKVLPKGSRKLLTLLAKEPSPLLKGWTLAGGTGLALHLGHRISEDFDFFRTTAMDLDGLLGLFQKMGRLELMQEEGDHTLTFRVLGVKISFFKVRDPFLFKPVPYRFFSIAHIKDIALMKLIAISRRGSRKDFVDLHTLLRGGTSLKEFFKVLPKKYRPGRTNAYHILKSLTFFEDAEQEPMPRMLEPFDWEECKAFFVRETHSIVLPPKNQA